jgi:hypothetical protein
VEKRDFVGQRRDCDGQKKQEKKTLESGFTEQIFTAHDSRGKAIFEVNVFVLNVQS